MNLFQKYGIKEVADVTFYTITKVGEEEIYTPVLFLDTLKVSTLEKSAEKVEARGGKGNKKLITWNFGKEISLQLEDALFNPASMSMIWGGTLNTKMSLYTSIMSKVSVANKYGSLNYSIKAYPSPVITDDEWEIIFKSAEEQHIDCGRDGEGDKDVYVNIEDEYVSENRKTLKYNYYHRTGNRNNTYVPEGQDISLRTSNINFKYDTEPGSNKIRAVSLDIQQDKIEKIRQSFNNEIANKPSGSDIRIEVEKLFKLTYQVSNYAASTSTWIWGNPQSVSVNGRVNFKMIKQNEEILATNIQIEYLPPQDTSPQVRVMKTADKRILLKNYEREVFYQLFGNKLVNEPALSNLIITDMISKIKSFKDIGEFETDYHEIEVLDRMEKCIVKNKEGLKIKNEKQKQNLLRYYLDDRSSSYTIFYDAKTMLPLLNMTETGDIVPENEEDNYRFKIGTVYYKWTRTVKRKSDNKTDDGILGQTLVIDAETFPDNYKIVGETYIRNQKTGKDQRYQFIINRAAVSSNTNITLAAEGDPTTFSMSIDVLTPPNDIMMELREYDVIEDNIEGGTRVIPQSRQQTFTKPIQDKTVPLADKNEEIY